ncbi:MAG: DUF192 domain-containing protein [Chloroflexia bacterium]
MNEQRTTTTFRQPAKAGFAGVARGFSRRARALSTLMLLGIVLYGCGTDASTSTPILQPTPLPSPTPTNPQSEIPNTQSTWVPPTALVGTPRPGAEATLTAAPRLKTGTLTILNAEGVGVNIHVEIADSQATREIGLMHRTSMAPDAGMLFDFGGESAGGFWMQNTLLPLSIAFIAQDGTILNIEDMQPLDTSITQAAGAYHYALETNQGFFRANNILPGGKALLPVVLDPAGGWPAPPGMPDCPDTSTSALK